MDNEIISFDILKINKGRDKICKCKTPQYEIDTKNRLVMCLGCGAVVEPFEALISLAQRYEELEEFQRKSCIKRIHIKNLQKRNLTK